MSVEYYYFNIRNTRSFASVLWLFGLFLFDEKEYSQSCKRLEDAKTLFENLKVKNKYYYQCTSKLCEVYIMMFDITKKKDYLKSAQSLNKFLFNANIESSIRTINNKLYYLIKERL